MSWMEEIKSGDRRRALVALRDEIAVNIEAGVAARDLASLSKRLHEIINELDAMPNAKEESGADEIARKRRERRERARAASS